MTAGKLVDAFARWRRLQQPLVLATVYESQGSTYSKAGAQMLINADGDFQGMLSGGCLEGDLAERARQVADNGRAQSVTYDLTQDDDALWGLGVGCDGLMRIFLQRLLPDRDYQPLPAMLAAYEGSERQVALTVISADRTDLPAGSCVVMHDGRAIWSDIDDALLSALGAAADDTLAIDRSRKQELPLGGAPADILASVLRPLPRVLVLGAGLDAEPVVRLVRELGWRVVVSDHRPAYIQNGDFSMAESAHCTVAAEIDKRFELGKFDAAIVMSHHLVSDETYLRLLAPTSIRYIGLLGPINRRRRLLEQLGKDAAALSGRLHGPAGIDIHASGPASIALSIVAEMHRELIRRD